MWRLLGAIPPHKGPKGAHVAPFGGNSASYGALGPHGAPGAPAPYGALGPPTVGGQNIETREQFWTGTKTNVSVAQRQLSL